ncbi:MAG: WYL domain-containing protein [Clostridia bacterium]|nr:WYL domain-containing protein [Clostridia bacterium]
MPKNRNQKLKILYLLKILTEKTDESHPMSMPNIITELERYGISAERKSIYDDLEALELYGADICSVKGKNSGYFLASRDFELPELKLLVDSVQASKFITKKKSMELISKLEKLASTHEATHLQRQVFVTNRVKAVNETIYYVVDKIYDAISRNKKISFRYFEWTVEKEKRYRKDGERYVETPVTLSWDDENYYLITYKEKYKGFTHYRVDKMTDLEILSEAREMPEEKFDPADYAKKVFGMFGGEETAVEVKFHNALAGVVIDRFGEEVFMRKLDSNWFVARFKVAISPQFFSWIMSFGSKAEIISPADVRGKLRELLKELSDLYKN